MFNIQLFIISKQNASKSDAASKIELNFIFDLKSFVFDRNNGESPANPIVFGHVSICNEIISRNNYSNSGQRTAEPTGATYL